MTLGITLELAIKNIQRNKRRNLISSVAIIAAVFALIMGFGLVDGIDENTIRAQEDQISGHIILRPDDYPTDNRNYPIGDAATVPTEIMNHPEILDYAPRLFVHARLIRNSDSLRVKVIAHDPIKEEAVFNKSAWLIDGTWPQEIDEIGVGSGLAYLMGLNKEDVITLEARTRPGSINARQYRITAIVNSKNASLDAFSTWLPYTIADELLFSEGARSHIALKVKGGRANSESIAQSLEVEGWTPSTALEEISDLIAINRFRRKAVSFISFILMAIAATGIANTIIMATYERIPEVGTLRAMGMQNKDVQIMFLLEGTIMGCLAGICGGVLGGSFNFYLSQTGIDLSSQVQNIGEVPIPTVIYTYFSWAQIALSISFGAIVALLASIWPAKHAVSIHPADAVRRN